MAIDCGFRRFGRSVLAREVGEIGLHIHPWNSPPLFETCSTTVRSTGFSRNGLKTKSSRLKPVLRTTEPDPAEHHVYLTELSDELLVEKVGYLTRLLSDVFEIRPVSHRAGRWGFDERVARVLVDFGYLVDCSVTPGVSWKRYRGAPDGNGGPDYFGFPSRPYFLDPNDIRKPGVTRLLEVPMTIKPNYGPRVQKFHHEIEDGLAGKVLRKALGPPFTWLRPNGRNLREMLELIDWALDEELPVLEFMLHSSEFMPGGSPTFKTAEEIELLYGHLRALFNRLESIGVRPMTLAEYHHTHPGTESSPRIEHTVVAHRHGGVNGEASTPEG
jgi:hypothetical protein